MAHTNEASCSRRPCEELLQTHIDLDGDIDSDIDIPVGVSVVRGSQCGPTRGYDFLWKTLGKPLLTPCLWTTGGQMFVPPEMIALSCCLILEVWRTPRPFKPQEGFARGCQWQLRYEDVVRISTRTGQKPHLSAFCKNVLRRQRSSLASSASQRSLFRSALLWRDMRRRNAQRLLSPMRAERKTSWRGFFCESSLSCLGSPRGESRMICQPMCAFYRVLCV
jgi:hypothetical protein